MKKRNYPDPMIFKKNKPTGKVRKAWGVSPHLTQQAEAYRLVEVNGEKVKVFTDRSGNNTVVREGYDDKD